MNRWRSTLSIVPIVVILGACSASPPSESLGDSGEESSAIDTAASCDRTSILASVTGARRAAIERGLRWYDARVPYSQSRSHEGYRTDCSGSGHGHVVLFVGWTSAARDAACVLEEASTQSGVRFRARRTVSLHADGFKPIRADALAADTSPTPDPGTAPDQGDASAPPAPPPPDPAAGGGSATCAGDGDCNPGNDGSGQICTAEQCVAGCRRDNQCPGATTCVAGQCR